MTNLRPSCCVICNSNTMEASRNQVTTKWAWPLCGLFPSIITCLQRTECCLVGILELNIACSVLSFVRDLTLSTLSRRNLRTEVSLKTHQVFSSTLRGTQQLMLMTFMFEKNSDRESKDNHDYIVFEKAPSSRCFWIHTKMKIQGFRFPLVKRASSESSVFLTD